MDTNGDAVPDIKAVVTVPNLILSCSATTHADGRYRILNLPPGRYAITVAATRGFASFEQTDIEVSLGKTSVITIPLEVAKIGEKADIRSLPGAG